MQAGARWSRGHRNQQALGGKGVRREVWLEEIGPVELAILGGWAHGFIRVKERETGHSIVHSYEAYFTR